MKLKCFLLVLVCLLGKISSGQEKKPEIINAKEIIQKGVDLYEAEKYEEALTEFLKIPESDTAYFSSVVEQVLAYYQLKRYDEGIATGKKALALKLYLAPEIFTNIGCCYDMLEKYSEAIKLYDEGIRLFPKANSLYYNKAYSLTKLEKHKEAFECYKKSAELNPFHPGTHFALGVMAMNEGKTSLAMLALSTFILLDPYSKNANAALVSINDMASSKYQEKTKPKDIDITDGDDFSDIDMLIQNYVALDKKYKVKSKLTTPFVKQDYLLFDKLPENPDNKGFWYKTYVSFYKQVLKEGKFDLFANYMIIPSANEYHKKLVEKNKPKLIVFSDWKRDTWDSQHREYEMEFNGRKQKVDVFRANKRFAISSIGTLNDAKTSFVGYTEIYHANGKLKAKGKYNNEGKRDGEWIWYHENGNIDSKTGYNNGALVYNDSYSFPGILQTHIPYKNGKIDGDGIVYTNSGAKLKLIAIKDGEREGNYEEYYSNGQILFKGTNKKGKLDGAAKTYYSSGELKSEIKYLEGEKNGPETFYYRNGKILQKSNYVNGKLQDDFVSYYDNGKISNSLKYLNDNPIGKNTKYYADGVISETADFDESGKLNGLRKVFDTDGKIYYELEYRKGEIIGYKYYDKKGGILKQDKKKSGNFDFEGYYQNGIRRSTGKYGKEDKQGEWKFYDKNGNLESISNYTDGKAQDEYKGFFPNGKVKKILQYKDDLAEGYYVEYNVYGNIDVHGNYKNDNWEGDWISYNSNKTLASEKYYIGGSAYGTHKYYAINGRLTESKTFYNGVTLNSVNYDTLGNVIDSINYINASGKLVYHFYKGGPVKCELNMLYDNYHNDYVFYYPNGKIRIKGQYFNGQKNGTWTWYSWNGNISTKGNYEYGDLTGTWEYYNEDGSMNRTVEYKNDKLEGKRISYHYNGKIESERSYADDLLEGYSLYYSPDGQLEHKRLYLHDQLMSYVYFDANGAEKIIEINNETADIRIYFKNGKLARQFGVKNGLYQGEYTRYYPSGQLFEKLSYTDDEASGENTYYYPDGKIMERRHYICGELHGLLEKNYPDGKLKETTNYVYDELHGKCHKYDKSGKLIAVLTYYNDVLIAISNK